MYPNWAQHQIFIIDSSRNIFQIAIHKHFNLQYHLFQMSQLSSFEYYSNKLLNPNTAPTFLI